MPLPEIKHVGWGASGVYWLYNLTDDGNVSAQEEHMVNNDVGISLL